MNVKTTLHSWDKTKVWFLAHPLGSDERFQYHQNLQHIVHGFKMFRELGVRVVVPYYIDAQLLDDNDPKVREECLEITSYLVSKIKRVIFYGHRMSSGMAREYETLARVDCCAEMINFVGVPDDIIRQRLRPLNETK